MEFKREGKKFICQGMQLTRPVDLLAEGKYAILKNVRAYVDGTIKPRLGLSTPSSVLEAPVHSIKRFYNRASNSANEIEGGGTKIYFNGVQKDTGYSGNPLSFVPYRPLNSSETHVYMTEGTKMKKVAPDGTVFNMGIAPPNLPPTAVIGAPAYTTVESFQAIGTWTNGGTAGAIALMAGKRINTTITYALYDTGTTGWACIVPAAMTPAVQPGALVVINATETVKVESVFNAIVTTTISSIKYDSGSTGLCTIQLTAPSVDGLERDAIVRLAAAENVRVLSVTTGQDGLPSFRCSTTGTRAAGNAVAGLASFRAYTTINHVAAETITDEAFETTVAAGIGYISNTASTDMSIISSRPVKPDDIIHVSIKMDLPGQLIEGKIMFNVDSTIDFDHNYYYFAFHANDLQKAVDDVTVTPQTIAQRQSIAARLSRLHGAEQFPEDQALLEDPIIPPDPNQAATGASQWSEITFKVSDLVRVGSDTSKTLANVNALRVQMNVTAATVVDVDSLWVGGTYGLFTESFPYVYTYRYRASATGATSNPAPPMRSGLMVNRGGVVLTPTVSSDAQVDKIDYFRWGGTLVEWHLVGTGPNSGTFTDTFPDEQIVNNIGLDEDNFQPFPFLDGVKTGTCDVVGTEITRVSGDFFNLSWSRGSLIVIDGVPTSLYNQPTAPDRLSLEDNQGTKTSVTFYLPAPTILGQATTPIWGPYNVGGATFIFSCKNGILLYTKGNNPDSAPEDHQLEITSPSEPLVGGCIYDGQCFVFSTERMFRIIPNFSAVGNLFLSEEMPIGKGLIAPWAICTGELIIFAARDGLYQTNGTQLKSITDEDLYPLFPHDAQQGSTVNGIVPPNFNTGSGGSIPLPYTLAHLRLAAGDGLIKFTFKDTNSTYHTLVYDTRFTSWVSYDTYAQPVVCHYWDEGGANGAGVATVERVGSTDGKVYIVDSTTDNGTDITSVVRTKSMDFGDTRAEKLFGDLIVDFLASGSGVSTTVGFNNHSSTTGPFSLIQATRGQSIVDLFSGAGAEARNISLDLSSTDPSLILYEWQPSFIQRPEDSKQRYQDYTDAGVQGAKWLQGIILTCDTDGVTRSIQVQGDNGVVIATLSVNHNGFSTVAYPKAGDTWTPRVTHLMRLVPLDSSEWKVYNMEWVFEPSPEAAIKWQSQGTTHGFEDFHHLRRAWIAIESNSDVTLTLTADGIDYTYTVPSTSGLYKKILLPLRAVKAKLFTYKFTAIQPFRLFLQDSVVEVAGWGEPGLYKMERPFGDMHHGHTYSSYAPTEARI